MLTSFLSSMKAMGAVMRNWGNFNTAAASFKADLFSDRNSRHWSFISYVCFRTELQRRTDDNYKLRPWLTDAVTK